MSHAERHVLLIFDEPSMRYAYFHLKIAGWVLRRNYANGLKHSSKIKQNEPVVRDVPQKGVNTRKTKKRKPHSIIFAKERWNSVYVKFVTPLEATPPASHQGWV